MTSDIEALGNLMHSLSNPFRLAMAFLVLIDSMAARKDELLSDEAKMQKLLEYCVQSYNEGHEEVEQVTTGEITEIMQEMKDFEDYHVLRMSQVPK